MVNVFKLGYVDFASTNVERLVDYYSNILGLTVTERSYESAYFSTSTDHHNIAIHASDTSGVRGFGLQLVGNISVKEAASFLNKEGIKTEIKSDVRSGVSELAEFKDQDGFTVQLYSQMDMPAPGFKRVGVMPNKIGHLSLRVKDAKKAVEFYKLLGFINTDWIEDFFGFTTCNTDHHVLNFCTSDRIGLHHIAFELRDYSHMLGSLDFLGHNNIPILWGPSRHGAGHNIATYHYDPDKNFVEMFADLDVYIRETDSFEPRPWHSNVPQKPMVWDTDECISKWSTVFSQSLV